MTTKNREPIRKLHLREIETCECGHGEFLHRHPLTYKKSDCTFGFQDRKKCPCKKFVSQSQKAKNEVKSADETDVTDTRKGIFSTEDLQREIEEHMKMYGCDRQCYGVIEVQKIIEERQRIKAEVEKVLDEDVNENYSVPSSIQLFKNKLKKGLFG